jgi:nucleoside-diphosphate-sugar epimerase
VVKRVAVTGAAGMLGSTVAGRLLADGHQVNGIDLVPAPHGGHPRMRHRQGDIRDRAMVASVLADADAVVHCAGALPSYRTDLIRSTIVDGTSIVLSEAARAAVPRVVHISTSAVYGLPDLVPTPEVHPRRPVDTYGRAKAAAEQIAERYRDDGRCVTVLRPKTFLGPGRMGLFAMLFEWAEEGRNFPVLGRGTARIQMLAIEDLVDAVVTVLDAPAEVAADTYNVAAVEFGTLRDDFQAVLDAAGRGGRVVSVPARPAVLALRTLERTRLSPVYGRLVHKLLADSYVSVDKAHQRLGFRPRLSNQDAILATYAWWRECRAAGQARASGQTSRDPWRQGALSLAKVFF